MDGPAAIRSDASADLWFTLPTIHSAAVGRVRLTFTPIAPRGSAIAAFSLGPALHTDEYHKRS